MRSRNPNRKRKRKHEMSPVRASSSSSAKHKMSRVLPEALHYKRKHEKSPDRDALPANENKMSRTKKLLLKLKKPGNRTFSRPFKIGSYAPGTAPRRIPYHLYLLVNQAVGLMMRKSSDHSALKLVENKIGFFCDYFYSHLPLGWKYERYNAASLIAGYDASWPKYNMSGFAPLGHPLTDEFDHIETQLYSYQVFEIMRIIHSRKTPTPDIFRQWNEYQIAFYCKLCSCFGIDYQRLEAASKNDVRLMNMGISKMGNRRKRLARGGPYHKWVEKISSNKDVYVFKHMRKLSSSDEAFELSMEKILEILRIVTCSPGLPQTKLNQWNEPQISFYCKMCSCFGVDYQVILVDT